jgi:ABC-type branched-subunit amino acid transport system substrate-binding protein
MATYVSQQGWQNVAIVYADHPYGQSEQVLFDGALTKAGVKVESAKFADTALDMSPILQSLRACSPKALLVLGYGPAVGHLFNSLGTLGWKLPLLGNAGVGSSNVPGLAPASTPWAAKCAACWLDPH